ncbi:MAG: aspartate kinase [Rikenellaceae bacterium]
MLKTLKFGGETLRQADDFKKVAQIIIKEKSQLTVFSAMSGTYEMLDATMKDELEKIDYLMHKYRKVIDELLVNNREAGYETLRECFAVIRSSKNINRIFSQAEVLTSTIFILYAREIGMNIELLYAADFVHKNADGEGSVDSLMLRNDTYYVTQGFVCSDSEDNVVRFGFGGSDYSAALLGAALNCSEVQIWGVGKSMYTGDPAIVEGVKSIAQMSYSQAAELAYFGANILHPSIILPCRAAKIDVVLKDFNDPESSGTRITHVENEIDFLAASSKDNISLIRITSDRMLLAYGFLRKVLEVFERYETPVDMITTSEIAVSITIDDLHAITEIESALKDFGVIEIEHSHSIVCVVGNMTYGSEGMASTFFDTANQTPIKMISYGASQRSISLLVESCHKNELLQNINKLFV